MSSTIARAALALLLCVLVVGESAGIARARGASSLVHCCCGAHSVARACRCLSCPLRLRHGHPHDDARLGAADACPGGAVEADALRVAAVLPAAPRAPAREAGVALVAGVARRPPTISLDPARPPP